MTAPRDDPNDPDRDGDIERRIERGVFGSLPDAYELVEGFVPAPPLPGEVITAPDPDSLVDSLAADLVVQAANCLRSFGDFHLALSGGRSPELLYERLMYDPNYRGLPWRKTHLWIVEERCVPFDDPRSAFRLIRDTIVDHSDIPMEQVHPIFAMGEAADVAYEQHLRETLGWRERGQDRLDFVLLGVGADGSTAGLFPRSKALRESARLVMRTPAPDGVERVTMTLPMINAARFVAVLAIGAQKADVIRRLATEEEPAELVPIKGVRPVGGTLRWYLDAAAAPMP